jgi:hypothetical protein
VGARALRNLHALAVGALLATTLLVGCQADLGAVARDEGVPVDAIVRLDKAFAVAARPTGSGVEVIAFLATEGGGWTAQVIASDAGGEVSANLLSMSGETGDEWNSFFYGTAPGSASRVVVEGFGASGGRVTDGAWVLAFRQKDLHPDQLSWSVLDATGGIIASGTGITP